MALHGSNSCLQGSTELELSGRVQCPRLLPVRTCVRPPGAASPPPPAPTAGLGASGEEGVRLLTIISRFITLRS
jgi:hypothetical protein